MSKLWTPEPEFDKEELFASIEAEGLHINDNLLQEFQEQGLMLPRRQRSKGRDGSEPGRRPRLVRWTWQRNVTHRFQYREQRLRCFTDGVVALCIRTEQADGSTQDRWYGLFLLCTQLDDERLMRLRLERLLC